MHTPLTLAALAALTAAGPALAQGQGQQPSQTPGLDLSPRLALATTAELAAQNNAAEQERLARLSEVEAASRRAQSPLTEGWDESKLDVSGTLQTLFQANHTDGQPTDATNTGFETVRTRLIFDFRPTDKVRTAVQFDASSETFKLLDAWVDLTLDEGIVLRIGQQRLPFSREFMASIFCQQGVDRSIVNKTFTADRAQMIQLTITKEQTKLYFAFSDGANSKNTAFNSTSEANFGLTARVEQLLIGKSFKQFSDFSSWVGNEDALLVGAAVHFDDDQGGRPDLLRATADISYETSGANIHGAFYLNHATTGTMTPTDYGFQVQGGYFFNENTEGYARYGVVIPDTDRANDDLFHDFTVGVNHFLVPESHAFRVVAELSYFPTGQSDSIVPTSNRQGILASDDSQWNARIMVQLLF